MEEIGSKEERRKRKKKIEVSELFRCYKKRPSNESPRDGGTPNELDSKEEIKDNVTPDVNALQNQLPTKKKKKKDKKLIKEHGKQFAFACHLNVVVCFK